MKIILKCATTINEEKIPAVVQVKNTNLPTCLDLPDEQARAIINRQHARLAKKDEKVNFTTAAKKAEK